MGSTPTTHPIEKPLAMQGVFHFSYTGKGLLGGRFRENCMRTHTKVYPIIQLMQNGNAKRITRILQNSPASDLRLRSCEIA